MSKEGQTPPGPRQSRRKPLGVAVRLLLLIGLATTLASVAIYWRLNPIGTSAPKSATPSPALVASRPIKSTVIQDENLLPGTSSWQIPDAKIANGEIQGYASAISVAPGQSLTLYVSTKQAGDPYTISVYRLGWYGGKGGRLLATAQEKGQAQGWYDESADVLTGCTSCVLDASTHELEANWQPSYTLAIPTSWVTGVYYVKFTESGGKASFTMFDVTGDAHTTYIATTGDATWAAYNRWGGYSLYQGPGGDFNTRARAVSLDRPTSYYEALASLSYEIGTLRWIEREGYDVSYVSDIALNANPLLLLTHRVYISLGHDEYWSRAMRDNVTRARDAGVALLFTGADAAAWQIRFAADGAGGQDRVIICYKAATEDPLYGKDNSLVTVEWRDPIVNEPENELIGIMWSNFAHSPTAFPWHLDATADPALIGGTGLVGGTTYGCDIVGHEWDRVWNNGYTPLTLSILSTSPTVGSDGTQDVSNTTYYIADSGALVFATGTLNWGYALDDLRLFANPACAGKSAPIPGMQALMANVMRAAVGVHQPGQPALPNPLPTV